MAGLKPIDAVNAKKLFDSGNAIMVDVREQSEHNRSWVPGAVKAPLSHIHAGDFSGDPKKTAIFFCEAGVRTKVRGERLAAAGYNDAYELVGGLKSWRKAGFDVTVDANAPDPSLRFKLSLAGLLVGILGFAAWIQA